MIRYAVRQVLLGSTGLVVALGTASSVGAQTTATSESTLTTIIVTAERREADIQETPLAVTAISGESLEKTGTSTIQDVLRSVPSVQVTGGGAVAVRGIGTDGVNKMPATAIYQDGITVYNLSGYYFDLARVEVLAGPQGTLYGGTATGGAVNVITNNPRTDRFEALAQGELGNYNLYHTTAMANIPVADSFAIRLAGNWQQRDSYASDRIHGVDMLNLRGKALWNVNERLSVLFGTEYFHNTSLGAYLRNVNHSTGEPIDGDVPPNGDNDVTVQKYYLNVDADLGFADLTYIPGFQTRDAESLSLGGFLGNQSRTPNGEYLTQELRLASKPGSNVSWVGGLYYYNEKSTTTGNFGDGRVLPFVPFFSVVDEIDNDQRAVFGQVTVPLTDTLRITGGARYSEDNVNHPQTNNGVTTPFEGSYHSFDYLARLEYDLNDNSLLYGSLSTGYRPGGIAQAPNEYGNEEITAYEIGSKNTLYDTLILNGNVFYYDYSGFQTGLTVPCFAPGMGPANCFVFEVKSIPAEFKGAELMATWSPTRADTVSLSATYIKSKYTGDASVSQYFGGPIVPLATKDHAVTHTATWAANMSYQHTMFFGNDSSLFGRIDASYQDDSFTNFDPCIFSTAACSAPVTPIDFLQKAYTVLNLSVGYTAANDSWSVTAYARNLSDEVYKLAFGPSQATPGAPRTYGLTVSKRW